MCVRCMGTPKEKKYMYNYVYQGVIQNIRIGGETATRTSKKHGSLGGSGACPPQNLFDFFTSLRIIHFGTARPVPIISE